MPPNQIQFTDGSAYERYMGKWSQLAGRQFLDWLAPKPSLRWLDVGCGNGAFTELLFARCGPAAVDGVDPSEAQLEHARKREAVRGARFHKGDAMALPFGDSSFDAAVMPLVIFFVPDPAKGVAEMARVVSPGGVVAAYAWDLDGGHFPYQLLREELEALGIATPLPPSPDASRLDVMRDLWTAARLVSVETRAITVERSFENFDDYWSTVLGGPSVGPTLAGLPAEQVKHLQHRLRSRLNAQGDGPIMCRARANAVKGQVAK